MNRVDFPYNIDPSWTLFLDRDGVLNTRIIDDYVRNWDDFEWLPDVLEALKGLSKIFGKIVVITNQRGIARGLYSENELQKIHQLMLKEVKKAGARIDGIYFCPHDKDEDCVCRKPKPGMLLQAAKDFPTIDFTKSIFVGDSLSDMLAARAANVMGVFIGSVSEDQPSNVLTTLPNLATFARMVQNG